MPHDKLFKIGVHTEDSTKRCEKIRTIKVNKSDLVLLESTNLDITLPKCDQIRFEPRFYGFSVYLSANNTLTNGTVTDNIPIAPTTFIKNPSGNEIGFIEGIVLDVNTGVFRVPHTGIYAIKATEQVSCADATLIAPCTFVATLEGPSFVVATATEIVTDALVHTLYLLKDVKLFANVDYRFRISSTLNNKVLYGLGASNFGVSSLKITC